MSSRLVAVGAGRSVSGAVRPLLEEEGWQVEQVDDAFSAGAPQAILFDPGLLEATAPDTSSLSRVLADLETLVRVVEERRSEFNPGLSIIAVASDDSLGVGASLSRASVSGGLIAMTRAGAFRLAQLRQDISMNVIVGRQPHSMAEALTASDPTFEDIAEAVTFFARSENSFITGQTFAVCGGSDLLSRPLG